ncbi:fumarylacetoacetate hydrolase family protein [Cnuibacter sp. UC19_7]|uniref:fumarylacetoacetate hydrolase family protein n=1 Tax=Cnuibacter sp. UC19_7 TaxID=3350166 RepID=UPI003670E5C2
MKVARFSHDGAIDFGILDEDEQELVVLKSDPLFAGLDTTGERVPLAAAKLLAPVIPRSKVVAVGRNYRAHAAEFGNDVPAEPMLFFKPNTSVIGPGDTIVRPRGSEQVDFEGELAVVVGAVARHVRASDAHAVIFGYTVGNDVSARDWQRSDGQWARAKGFDTSCPLGPFIETDLDVSTSRVRSSVNGELKQDAPFTDMVHDVAKVIEYASAVFTLLPGDVILTGTPAGVGPIVAGDRVDIEIDGIGILSNPVA